ncbi:MAG TPA: hypothetical protein VLI67_02060, partial [Vicinamibacteria bacterium]|nr:hypothetical protein [Vicinamibacteria bacterium]
MAVAGLGLGQHLRLDFVPQVAPPAATFANRNMAAQFMVLAFPVAVVRFLRAPGARGSAMAALAGASMAGYVFQTLTRSAWLAVAVEALLLAVLGRRRAAGHLGRARTAVGAAGVA